MTQIEHPPDEWDEPEPEPETVAVDGLRVYRRDMRLLGAIGIVILLCGAALSLWIFYVARGGSEARQDIDRLEARQEETGDDLGRLFDAVDQLREQLIALDVRPATPPPEDLVEESGTPTPRPDFSSVVAAVETYCADHDGCIGQVDVALVTDAVNAYCDARDQCRGEQGEPGEAGDGAGGDIVVTEDQVVAALVDICGDCVGPMGPSGPAGQDGADGEDGQDGADGAPGPICQAGYSPVQVVIPSEPDRIFQICAAVR